ncbi:hypothetical protein EIQ26_11615 [Xanthomonas campestris pv. incanae]
MPPRVPTCADGWAARLNAAINTIAQPPGGRGLRSKSSLPRTLGFRRAVRTRLMIARSVA